MEHNRETYANDCGFRNYQGGKPLSDNPYDPEYYEVWICWRRGWKEAHRRELAKRSAEGAEG